jgi:hypothetical protein
MVFFALLVVDICKPAVSAAVKYLSSSKDEKMIMREEIVSNLVCEMFGAVARVSMRNLNGDNSTNIERLTATFAASATPVALKAVFTWTFPRLSDLKPICSDVCMEAFVLAMNNPTVRECVAKHLPWREKITQFGRQAVGTAVKHIILRISNTTNTTLHEELTRDLSLEAIKSLLDRVQKWIEAEVDNEYANALISFVNSAGVGVAKSLATKGEKPEFADFAKAFSDLIGDLAKLVAVDSSLGQSLQNIPFFGSYFVPEASELSKSSIVPDPASA